MKKLKILHTVEFYHPIHGGSQEVVKRISEGLVKKGHDVTVATSYEATRKGVSEINGVKVKEFKVKGKIAYGMQGDLDGYRQYVLENDFDLMLNYSAQQWSFDALLPILDQIKAKKVLVPCGFSGLHLNEFKQYFIDLPGHLAKLDHLVFLSHHYRDIDFCREKGFQKYSIIPNGCAFEEFIQPIRREEELDLRSRLGIPVDDFIVLHVGSHTGVKGHTEAIRIFNQAKLSNATLVIVGNVFDPACEARCIKSQKRSLLARKLHLSKSQILSLHLSREDTVKLYKAAGIFLFPSNIECSPIVLFEAMASKTPFLATDVGNSVEIAEMSRAGEIMDTFHPKDQSYIVSIGNVEDGVKRLRGLFYDAKLREFYANNGFEAWRDTFTWEKITDIYEKLYSDLVG